MKITTTGKLPYLSSTKLSAKTQLLHVILNMLILGCTEFFGELAVLTLQRSVGSTKFADNGCRTLVIVFVQLLQQRMTPYLCILIITDCVGTNAFFLFLNPVRVICSVLETG